MAMTQGAEGIDLNEDWYDSEQITDEKVMRMHDFPQFAASGLSLGYESVQSQNP